MAGLYRSKQIEANRRDEDFCVLSEQLNKVSNDNVDQNDDADDKRKRITHTERRFCGTRALSALPERSPETQFCVAKYAFMKSICSPLCTESEPTSMHPDSRALPDMWAAGNIAYDAQAPLDESTTTPDRCCCPRSIAMRQAFISLKVVDLHSDGVLLSSDCPDPDRGRTNNTNSASPILSLHLST